MTDTTLRPASTRPACGVRRRGHCGSVADREHARASSPIRWKGSKRRVAATLVAALPAHACYVEVFGGGASVLFAKPPAAAEVYNDLNTELVTFFRVVRRHPRELMRELRMIVSAREEFAAFRAARLVSLTDIERAVRFFLLNRWSFAGKGEHHGTGLKPGGAFQWQSALRSIAAVHRRFRNVVVESLDYTTCLERYDAPGTVFFLDPPYLGTDGYGRPFGVTEHTDLAARAKKLRGKALVTVNDTPVMRRLWAPLPMRRFTTTVNFSAHQARGVPMAQLLIRSWR